MSTNNLSLLSFSLIFCLLFSNTVSGQTNSRSKMALQQKMQHVHVERPVSVNDFFETYAQEMGLSNPLAMRLDKRMDGHNGFKHWKYQQFHNGILVFGSSYILHEKDGFVKRASGYYLPLIGNFEAIQVSKEKAISKAKVTMHQEIQEEQPTINYSERNYQTTEPQLVIIDKAFPKFSEYYALAYQVDISSKQPYDKKRFFVDALTGQVLLDLPLIMQHAVPGKGVCKYYGEQDITIDSISVDSFVLRDLSRGNGNTTLKPNLQPWTNTSTYWDLTNENQDEVAIDAHYCTAEFYDYLLETFNWNGLGNQGESMDCAVYNSNVVNASWDGEIAHFGGGNCNYNPLTTLEVVGHEFTHGFTDYTSNLVSSGESAAINESMSDIFGKALEYHTTPNDFSWYIGHSFLNTIYSKPFRSFSDPHEFEHPKVYQGQYWANSSAHVNNAVGNHWFYLIVDGGMDTNELGYTYSIQGIGMEKAMQIVFLTQTTALVPNSDYAFYRDMSIEATIEIFGLDAPEVDTVEEAWRAVGSLEESSTIENFNIFDMALTGASSRIYTCVADDYYPLEITLSNRGNITYHPGMNGFIKVSAYNFIQFVEETIAPGEAVTYVLDNLIFLDDSGFEFITPQFECNTTESNYSNNSVHETIYNSYYPQNNLSLSTLIAENLCSNHYQVRFSIYNSSCDAIPKGTAFNLSLTNAEYNFEWTDLFKFSEELAWNNRYTIYADIEIPIDIVYGDILFEASLDYPAEVNEEDNFNDIEIPFRTVYQNSFKENFDDLNNPHLLIDGNSSNFEIKNYQGENYLATSSSTTIPFVFYPICFDYQETFNTANTASIEFCLDATNINEPLLSFDLIQFRSQENIDSPEQYPYTSIAKITWEEDGVLHNEWIYNQTEEELFHYDFLLPNLYYGKISLEFFNYSGDLLGSNYTDYDVILLDNLSITDGLVAVQDLANEVQLKIFPNPSNGNFRVEYTNQPNQITVYNLIGQEVFRVAPRAKQTDFSLNHLAKGTYFLVATYEDGSTFSEQLVKLD